MNLPDSSQSATSGAVARTIAAVAAGLTIGIACAVLIGWALQVEILMTVMPGYSRMKPNTALSFIGAGLAILLEYRGGFLRTRRMASFVPLALGGGTLFEYLSGVSLHIDELLFADGVQKIYPGRMAHLAATCFVILGSALLLRTQTSRSSMRTSALLALVVTATSLLTMVGYLYGVPILYGSIHYTAMAFHTGLSFLLLSLAVVFVDPAAPFARLIWSEGAGGLVARWLLPFAAIFPIVLGRIFITPAFSFHEPKMGMAFVAITSVILFVTLIIQLCRFLNTASRARLAAEQSMMTDALTGVPNRRYMDWCLAMEVERARRASRQLSFALFDADHFKKINDQHGHVAGDHVLRAIASLASSALRSSDIICRYGGEEFALVLPDTSAADASSVCERVRAAVEAGLEAMAGVHATISLGVTSIHADDVSTSELLTRADEALYAAKRAGRNCVQARPRQQDDIRWLRPANETRELAATA